MYKILIAEDDKISQKLARKVRRGFRSYPFCKPPWQACIRNLEGRK